MTRALALAALLIFGISAGSVRAGDTPVQEAAAAPPAPAPTAKAVSASPSPTILLTPAALLSFALMASSGTSLPQTGNAGPGR
jgi:hypothetical protein